MNFKYQYCKQCVYPFSAANLVITDGVCSSCQSHNKLCNITKEEWNVRKKALQQIFKENKKDNNYDCVIPVSGGKDSFFQTHYAINELGLKPLLVTYHGNNYLPEGDFNRELMRKAFNADHIVWGPGIDTLIKLNIAAFEMMGDMNWQNHCGIMTAPIIIATKFKIPFLLWGEVSTDTSGMFDPNDFVEFSNRIRKEHSLRGYDHHDFINSNFKINQKDMIWSIYPKDSEIVQSEIKGLFLGNYLYWDANSQTNLMKKMYGWKESEKPFERTYRRTSNLDDRYENGIHDLLKFIKFGYGRASDHASKDIRQGYMTRDEGIKMVLKYDHVVSSDLKHWLNYVNKSEDYFWKIADNFRDPRVWSIENKKWWKYDIDGEKRFYGEIFLSKKDEQIFNEKKAKLIKKYE